MLTLLWLGTAHPNPLKVCHFLSYLVFNHDLYPECGPERGSVSRCIPDLCSSLSKAMMTPASMFRNLQSGPAGGKPRYRNNKVKNNSFGFWCLFSFYFCDQKGEHTFLALCSWPHLSITPLSFCSQIQYAFPRHQGDKVTERTTLDRIALLSVAHACSSPAHLGGNGLFFLKFSSPKCQCP